ncbi:unnamed protein product [Boreogadus saida]
MDPTVWLTPLTNGPPLAARGRVERTSSKLHFWRATVVLKVVSWSPLWLPEVLARFCLHINDYPLSLGRTSRKG